MKNRKIYFIAAFIMMLLAACDDNYTPDTTPKKLFRPTNFTWEVDPDDNTVIIATWRSTKADSFLLQIAIDNTFTEGEVIEVMVEDKNHYEAKDLTPGQKYYARVKAVSADPAIADSEYSSVVSATLPLIDDSGQTDDDSDQTDDL